MLALPDMRASSNVRCAETCLPSFAQAGNFRAMEKLGEPIMKPFLQVGAVNRHGRRPAQDQQNNLVNLMVSARTTGKCPYTVCFHTWDTHPVGPFHNSLP